LRVGGGRRGCATEPRQRPARAEYLRAIRGKWINWSRRADNTAEVPENFAPSFASLMLHESVRDVALTDGERSFCEHILKVAGVLRYYHSLELKLDVVDETSTDGTHPDHYMVCRTCDRHRALSLITAKGTCAYCEYGADRAAAVDAADPDSPDGVLQVRCSVCHAYYSRNRKVNIVGGIKCHGCQHLGAPSPSVACKRCGVKVV
jgi:hypothetical protein